MLVFYFTLAHVQMKCTHLRRWAY